MLRPNNHVLLRVTLWLTLAVGSALGTALLWQWWQDQQSAVHWLRASGECQFGTRACIATDGRQSLQITASTDTFSSSVPFEVEVTAAQPLSGPLWLQLEGVDMYMGISRYRFEPIKGSASGRDGTDSDSTASRYRLELRLPTCTSSQMTWQATLLAEQAADGDTPPGITSGFRFTFRAIQ